MPTSLHKNKCVTACLHTDFCATTQKSVWDSLLWGYSILEQRELGGDLRYLDTCFIFIGTNYFSPKNHIQKLTPTTNPRLQKPIANQPSPPARPKITLSTDEPSPHLIPWFRFVYPMQIKIRQRHRFGARLEIAATLADFFISPYSCHKVRFTHLERSKLPWHKASGHCSQTSASADLPSSTTSPWLPIQPWRTIVSPAPLSIIHTPPHHHSQPDLPSSM